jgi:hypothetical protein
MLLPPTTRSMPDGESDGTHRRHDDHRGVNVFPSQIEELIGQSLLARTMCSS